MDQAEKDALVARAEAERRRLVGLGWQPRDFAHALREMFEGKRDMRAVKVGDQITVVSSKGEPVALRTVAAVTARQVFDSKQEAWLASNGYRWGSGSVGFYDGPYIRPTEPGDNERATFLSARRGLIRVCEEVARLAPTLSEKELEPYFAAVAKLREVHQKQQALEEFKKPGGVV